MQCIEIATNHRKSEYDKVSAEYESWKAKGLKLNMARGKPCLLYTSDAADEL